MGWKIWMRSEVYLLTQERLVRDLVVFILEKANIAGPECHLLQTIITIVTSVVGIGHHLLRAHCVAGTVPGAPHRPFI